MSRCQLKRRQTHTHCAVRFFIMNIGISVKKRYFHLLLLLLMLFVAASRCSYSEIHCQPFSCYFDTAKSCENFYATSTTFTAKAKCFNSSSQRENWKTLLKNTKKNFFVSCHSKQLFFWKIDKVVTFRFIYFRY